jgi:hypothetical protein
MEESPNNVEGGILRFCEEHPCIPICLVNDEEVQGVTIIRTDHPISRFVRTGVVHGGGAHEAKVHLETTFFFGSTNQRGLCRELFDQSLLLMVNVMEWVIAKRGGNSGDATRQQIKLADPRGSQT